MQRYGYQSLESKKWSTSTVFGVTALLSVSVGVTAGLVASNAASSTALYAPTSALQTTTTAVGAAYPVTSRAQTQQVQMEAAPAGVEGEDVEMVYMEAPQTSFSWGPVAALIALPSAVAAFLLRKADGHKITAAGLAASAVMASNAMAPMPANATEAILGLTPCAESKKFDQRLTKEVKTLENRQKKYEEGSAPYLALEATKTRTQARFAKYAEEGLLCGTDGLPHLISDPGLAVRYGHAGETLIPTVGFLYVAGYIGHAGRTYLQEISSRQKPTQSEIIIDVPLATSIAARSWDWPGKAFNEWTSGKLTAPDSEVPVSRR